MCRRRCDSTAFCTRKSRRNRKALFHAPDAMSVDGKIRKVME